MMSQQVLSIFLNYYYDFLNLHIVKAISQECFDKFSSNLAQTHTLLDDELIIF